MTDKHLHLWHFVYDTQESNELRIEHYYCDGCNKEKLEKYFMREDLEIDIIDRN